MGPAARGGNVSIRDQEKRQRRAERRMDAVMRRAEKEVKGNIRARQEEAMKRSDEEIRRIEVGDVQPRQQPGIREDSIESIGSMESMGSMKSMESMESAETVSGVTGEAEPDDMQENMPLQDKMPYDAESAHDDLAQRVTDETGSDGDPHEHAEAKSDELAKQMTDDTDAEGDMAEHADQKVEQMGDQLFEE